MRARMGRHPTLVETSIGLAMAPIFLALLWLVLSHLYGLPFWPLSPLPVGDGPRGPVRDPMCY